MSTNLDEEMATDEYIELKLERMAAMPPLGGVTRSVWGWAGSGPTEELALIAEESGDQLSAFIDNELHKRGVLLDARTLSALVEIVATAMIKQHEFTQTITNIACLGAPGMLPVALEMGQPS
jgi:hypothetical protein